MELHEVKEQKKAITGMLESMWNGGKAEGRIEESISNLPQFRFPNDIEKSQPNGWLFLLLLRGFPSHSPTICGDIDGAKFIGT